MRILYVATDQRVPAAHGGSAHITAVTEGLADLGHEVHAVVSPGDRSFPDGKVEWHAMSPPLGQRQLRFLLAPRVTRLAKTIRPDVVIERYYNFGGEGLYAARRVKALAVLGVESPVVDYPGSPKGWIDALLLVQPFRRWRDRQCTVADLIIAPIASILPDWVRSDRVVLNELGADVDRFHPGARGPVPFSRMEGETVVVFTGAFRAWHGVVTLVDAIRILRARGRHDVKAVLIGDGPELRKVRRAAEGIDGILLTGSLPHDQMPACLAAADIGVAPFDPSAHPPLALGFYWSPLKVFEYMASGLPVVLPRIERLTQLVGDGEHGLFYECSDPDALANVVERLTDAEFRLGLGAAARRRVMTHFTWRRHCEVIDQAIRRVVRR